MNIDQLLQSAAQALRVPEDSVAMRRAYHEVEGEFRRRSTSPDARRRWNEELTQLTEDNCRHRANVLQTGDLYDRALRSLDQHFGALPAEVDEEERLKRRSFMAHAAAVAVGIDVPGVFPADRPAGHTVFVERINNGQVDRLEAAVAALEALFDQQGSAACQATVNAVLADSAPLRHADGVERVRLRFLAALAKLHSLAGWVAFDLGSVDRARQHLSRALALAKAADNELLFARILCRAGNLYLHVNAPADALKLFQLSQISVQQTRCTPLIALICGLQAWAYATMGHEDQAIRLIGRAKEELITADPAQFNLLEPALKEATTGGRCQPSLVDAAFAEFERRGFGTDSRLTPVNVPGSLARSDRVGG